MKAFINIRTYYLLRVIIVLWLSLIMQWESAAQKPVCGVYNQYWQSITIKSDSSFIYTIRGDLLYRWCYGKWTIDGDTIYFRQIQVIDTIQVLTNKGLLISEHRIYSQDEIANTYKVFNLNPDSSQRIIQSLQMQELYQRTTAPPKLVIKGKRLYEIKENGKLLKRTKRSEFTNWKVRLGFKLIQEY